MTSQSVRPLVLVVEDDQDTRDMYAMFLDLSGIAVLTASNIDDAFDLALHQQPNVVITDFRLSGSSTGADLCRRLRDDTRTTHIPALLLTGSTQAADANATLDAGCGDIRIKPYLPDALLKDIQDIIARSSGQSLAR